MGRSEGLPQEQLGECYNLQNDFHVPLKISDSLLPQLYYNIRTSFIHDIYPRSCPPPPHIPNLIKNPQLLTGRKDRIRHSIDLLTNNNDHNHNNENKIQTYIYVYVGFYKTKYICIKYMLSPLKITISVSQYH